MTQPRKTTLRLVTVAWPFVLIVLLQTALATFSLQVTSSLRAFVTGESLWSKGQHDALYYLNRYAETGDAQPRIDAENTGNALGCLCDRGAGRQENQASSKTALV